MATTTLKDDALRASRLLAGLHLTFPDARQLDEFHAHMRGSLYRHRAELGLSAADVAEIDNAGVIVMGGTPKGPPPDDP